LTNIHFAEYPGKEIILHLWNSLLDFVALMQGIPEEVLALCIQRCYSIEFIGEAERFWLIVTP
jgi:hypothetical protein